MDRDVLGPQAVLSRFLGKVTKARRSNGDCNTGVVIYARNICLLNNISSRSSTTELPEDEGAVGSHEVLIG